MRQTLLVAILTCLSSIILFNTLTRSTDRRQPPQYLNGSLFFDHASFYNGIKSNQTKTIHNVVNAGGLIIPHHLVASEILTEAFLHLDPTSIENIVVLGPNHYESGTAPVINTKQSWSTPFGVLATSQKSAELLQPGLIEDDDVVMQNDHAITGLVPYFKYYLPNVTITPLLISNRIDNAQIKIIAQGIRQALSGKTLVIL